MRKVEKNDNLVDLAKKEKNQRRSKFT